jgi:putative glycosyltransferase
MRLSVVASLYQSAPYIEEFWGRCSTAACKLVGDDYEIVLVNDGSPDTSLELAIRLVEKDAHLTVIDLSRNFGHHKAMMTGLAHAKGEQIFLIDSDLEEEPEWLISFADQMAQNTCDVVYGVQERRKGGWFERWSGQCFYWLFRLLTGLNLPANVVTARLMSRRYVQALLQHEEGEFDIGGLWVITGFEQHGQTINKDSTSETTYTLRRKISLLVNSVTSFSNMPLIAIFYVGAAISLVASAYAAYNMMYWFFLDKPVDGWTSVIVSIWLLGGMTISFIGVIGIYLAKIFSETKRRPRTIIRNIYGKTKAK